MNALLHRTQAHAKLNLTLDVMAPRADGFHDLDSVVVKLSAFDEVTVTLFPGRGTPGAARLRTNDATLPTDALNLAVCAVHAFAAAAASDRLPALPGEVTIKLGKRLPSQAGLGGGSSDAAAVLRALSALVGGVSEAALREVAATIGSDVLLFLTPGPVRMRGRGEKVERLASALPTLHGVVVKPAEGVPTGPAYTRLDALPNRLPGQATRRLLHALQFGEATTDRAIAPLLSNDFEQAVLPAYPGVASAFDALNAAGALRVLLCGSGAAVFGLARDRDHARDMTRKIIAQGGFPWVKMVATVDA